MVPTAAAGRWTLAALAALLLLGAAASVAGVPSTPGANGRVDLLPGSSAVCEFPVPASGVHGQLSVEGGPLPSSAAAGVVLTYTYALAYRTLDLPNLTVVSTGCVAAEGNATTAANGSFSFVPPTPPTNCTDQSTGGEVCTAFSGPYVPIGISLATGPPTGYAVSVAGWSTPLAVTLVYELQSVTIDPGGPTVTTSVGAPTGFRASAWAADGTPSPLATTFSWFVNGTGWSFDGPATGPSVNLTAAPGSSVATVTVRADASVDNVELAAVVATVGTVAIPTEIETAGAAPTSLDVGGSMEVTLTASGAAGYRYSAFVEPGLDIAQVAVPCSTGPVADGSVEVECSANVTYPSAGTAQPTANVTNGYSSASWKFPDVVVNPVPELEVRPATPVGYALAPIAITVAAVNGTGTPPYAQACLATSATQPVCVRSAGPVWTFSPTFADPGSYTGLASATDAEGSNASDAFTVEVVPPLVVGAVSASSPNATLGATVELRAAVSGGVVPLRYWWNASGEPASLLDGALPSDGTLTAEVAPAALGSLVVTLTVLDRLGTVAASELVLDVGPAAAARVAAVTGPPAEPVTVGVAVPLTWGAFDASGGLDRAFAAPAELRLDAAGGGPEAWVNASTLGALAPLGNGTFGVPASAWVDGVLNVSLTVGTATDVSVELSGAGLPGPVAPMTLSVLPDRAHVRLYSPTVARPGARTNATLWRAEDRFGNPVPGALLTIDLSFGGVRAAVVVAAVALPGGGSGVWVNYTAPTAGDGEVTVVDEAGTTVLGPLSVPAAPTGPTAVPTVDTVAVVVPVGAAATFVVVRRRRRAREAAPAEDDLRRLAEGRARAVELIERAGAVDLAGLEAAWGGAVPSALADWVASLVADGTVRATIGEDGRARFCLARGPADAPRVTVDPEALDRSLRRRDEALDDGGPADRDGGRP